jgi:predicted transcriptional regulator
MSIGSQTPTQTDLEAFYSFVGQSLKQGEKEAQPEAVLRKWRAERAMEESCAAIMEGLADIEAGRCQPFEEVAAELRRKFGITEQ